MLRSQFPSVSAAYAAAFEVKPELFTLPGPNGVCTMQDWLTRWIVITFGMMMFPHITLRFFAGKNLRVLKWSAVFSSIYLTSIYIFTPAIGMVGNVLMPDLAAADTIHDADENERRKDAVHLLHQNSSHMDRFSACPGRSN